MNEHQGPAISAHRIHSAPPSGVERRRRRPGIFLAAGAMLLASSPAYALIDGYHTLVAMSDGVVLDAYVVRPDTPGPHPIIVAPTSWATPLVQWKVGAEKYANDGYAVVTYTPRGWWGSTGEIDVSGPDTVADVSEVIDWAVANLDGDEDRVGALGISYGAGVALLAAARDPRIRAVGAMSTWVDLERALSPNLTASTIALDLLDVGAEDGRQSSEMNRALADLRSGDFAFPREFASERSPMLELDALNANGTAVFVANSWEDGLFGPSPLIDFYAGLEGPKKLLLQPGDHGIEFLTEFWSLGWSPNYSPVVGDVSDWMDVHVAGTGGSASEGIELLSADNDFRTYEADEWESFATDRTYFLGEPNLLNYYTGGFRSRPSTGWHHSITGGIGTIANAGIPYLSSLLQIYVDSAISILTPAVSRANAIVWESEPFHDTDIVGIASLEVTVASSAADTQLVAYLYEKPWWGGPAELITHQPYTVRGLGSGEEETVSIDFEAVAWDIEDGSRLFVVIDTLDVRYGIGTQPFTSVTFSSKGTGAKITLPLRKNHGDGDGESADERRSFHGDFAWSSNGAIDGMYCTQILESADPDTWDDNYFCSSHDIGARWSSSGPIPNMACTQVHEIRDPHTWDDNFFCVPETSAYTFSWSSRHPIQGQDCLQWIERSDPHTWRDNFLCWTEEEDVEGVTVYRNRGFTGRREVLDYGLYRARDLRTGNNGITSIRIPAGYQVTLYDGDFGRGDRYVLKDDARYLGHFDDLTTSIEVSRPR